MSTGCCTGRSAMPPNGVLSSRTSPALSALPGLASTEIEIIREERDQNRAGEAAGRAIYPIVALALATGWMRRGELLALRWQDVDLDGGKLRVERSLEQTEGRVAIQGAQDANMGAGRSPSPPRRSPSCGAPSDAATATARPRRWQGADGRPGIRDLGRERAQPECPD